MIEFLDCFVMIQPCWFSLEKFSVMAKWLWWFWLKKRMGFADCSCAVFGKING
jgi:hypothetical protein